MERRVASQPDGLMKKFWPRRQPRLTPASPPGAEREPETALTFDIRNGDSGGIVLQPLDGEKRTLTTFNSDRVFWFDWSFDGKKFACIRGKHLTNIVMIKAEDKK